MAGKEALCSENEKDRKKGEKSLKRVLTFLREGDIIFKLTRAANAKRWALNLENDTEQETQNYDSNSEWVDTWPGNRLRYKQD